MATLGGWWMSKFSLESNESLEEKFPANRFEGEGRPHGGRLYLTDRRVIFLPQRLDAALGADPTAIRYEELAAVSVDRKEDHADGSGDLANRLVIEPRDGDPVRFVVDGLEAALAHLEAALETGVPTLPDDADTES